MSRDVTRFPPVAFPHPERSIAPRFEHTDRLQTLNIDAAALAAELSRKVRGEVRFDNGSRALYASDSSNYRQIPIGVVIPRDADDVVTTVELARRFGAPILGRGAGTSLAGQCCNVAVVLDMSKYMNRIFDLDPVANQSFMPLGTTANVVIHVSDATASLAVPITTIQNDANGEFVTVVQSDGTTKRVDVLSGAIVNELVVVSGDLQEGDHVQVNNASSFSAPNPFGGEQE